MLNEDFAACFTKIGPYKRDESMLLLLKMLDAERWWIRLDSIMLNDFGATGSARIRIDTHFRHKTNNKDWAVY